GFAAHRKDPGPALVEAVCDPHPRLRARAIEAVAELGRRDLAAYIKSPPTEPDEDCRFAAAWALTRFGWFNATLKSFVDVGGKYAIRALEMAMSAMDLADAITWYAQLKAQPHTRRLAVIGAGVIGDPVLLEDIISAMQSPQ